METIMVQSERKISFEKVEVGQAFLDEYGKLFMKFTPTCDADDADNAVCLNSGYGCMFSDAEEVILADARIVIMNRG